MVPNNQDLASTNEADNSGFFLTLRVYHIARNIGSFNLAVWLQIGHLKILAEFKFGGGPSQDQGAMLIMCAMC